MWAGKTMLIWVLYFIKDFIARLKRILYNQKSRQSFMTLVSCKSQKNISSSKVNKIQEARFQMQTFEQTVAF